MTETIASCPVSHNDYRMPRPLLGNFELLNAERERSPFFWNDGADYPFWMITRYEHVLEALQMPEVFSNDISNALSPKRPVKFQPNNLNAGEHIRLRKVLNRWFAPAAVRRIEPLVVSRCVELIEAVLPLGECDLIAQFALRYPTDMFLAALGLPIADGEQFVGWVDTVFSNLYMGPAAADAMESIKAYFDDAISERAARPRDPESDLLSRLLRPDIAGNWLTRDDLITVCLSLMIAGLDTTRSALGYAFQHLATHPGDRARMSAEPALIPKMVEELVRLYSLILQDGRLVTRDVDFHGLPMKAGDVVWLGVASANRDPRKFDRPDEFHPDRAELSHHLGFGAGPHRCLGMHLARHELQIALREWHRRIPDYQVAPGTVLTERGGQLSLYALPLQWPTAPVGNPVVSHRTPRDEGDPMTATPSEKVELAPGGCPFSHTDYRLEEPIFGHYEKLNAERERSEFLYNLSTNDPFYMVQRFDHVLQAMQMPDVFSNDIVNALDPFMEVRFLPNNLNPPDHTRMRKVLNRWFSPAAVRRIEPLVIKRCIELIEELEPKGEIDFVAEFGIRFPTEMFLVTIGLPAEDGEKFTGWVEALFAGFFGGPDPTPAAAAITEYFQAAIADRKANPRDPEEDFISRMLRPDLVGDWLSEEDLLLICLTLMTAGLDTTRAALGYIFQHLAGDDALRHRLTAEPELLPKAIEEFVRLYPLVIQDGRLVMQDIEFHGLQLRKGDVLWLGIGSANRDPRKYPNPDVFDMERPELNHHLGFAAGPHRCLGMHLARHELIIAIQEWHKRIPDYRIVEGTELRERGGQLTLTALPLRWTPSGSS